MSAEPLPAENVKPIRAVARRAAAVPAAPAVRTPMDIVAAALATGNVEMYREAVALAKELDAIAARKDFDNAMADAKAKIPTIKRNREVDSGGRGPKYRFEDLAEIAKTVDPILSECGLNYRYNTAARPGEPITVTCIISHRSGHREETSMSAGPDNGPGRNAIQQIGSTVTYLQRYTLKAALGLAVSHDDDGRTEPEPEAPAPEGSITEEQATFLREALEEKDAKETAFLQFAAAKGWFKGRETRLSHLPATHYGAAVNAIAGFRKA